MAKRKPSRAERGTWDDDEDPWVSHGTERYVVTISEDQHGRRTATRTAVHFPASVAIGGWVKASDRVLRDTLADLRHEMARREGRLADLGGWGRPSNRQRNRRDPDDHAPADAPELAHEPLDLDEHEPLAPDVDDPEGALDV